MTESEAEAIAREEFPDALVWFHGGLVNITLNADSVTRPSYGQTMSQGEALDSCLAFLRGLGARVAARAPEPALAPLGPTLDASLEEHPDLFGESKLEASETAPVDPERVAWDEERQALQARIDALEAAAVKPEEEPELLLTPDIPGALHSFILPDEDAVKFTERMRRRYRGLMHMQMDAARPTNARSLPDMSEEEIEDMRRLQALGAEAVAWLERD